MSKKKWAIIIFCSIIFILLAILYAFNSLKEFDTFFYNKITILKSPIITNFLKFFTMVGGVLGNIILINLVLIMDKKKGFYFLVNMGIVILLNLLLKNIFIRDRPIGINIIMENGYSFPSGHSMTAVAAYGLIIFYLYHSNYSKNIKRICILFSFIIMCLIPISRVYLGVHYFSDILAGACLSIIWLLFYTHYLKRKNLNL